MHFDTNCSGVTRGRGCGGGRTAPGDPPGVVVTPEWNKTMWLNLDRTVDKRGRRAKKVITLQTAMTKKGRQFKKIGMTSLVAAPGDTIPSDSTDKLRVTTLSKTHKQTRFARYSSPRVYICNSLYTPWLRLCRWPNAMQQGSLEKLSSGVRNRTLSAKIFYAI